jgi:sensor domain CHASE-containing protein
MVLLKDGVVLDMQRVTTHFISVDKVSNRKETTLHGTVKVKSGDQGFLSNASINACQTKR